MKTCLRLSATAVLLIVALLASPSAAFADTPPAECPAVEVEDVAVEPAGEPLFLSDEEPGGGDPQCDHVSGCGFVPRFPGAQHDDFCAAKCPAQCTGYDTGYWEEASGCCICLAV